MTSGQVTTAFTADSGTTCSVMPDDRLRQLQLPVRRAAKPRRMLRGAATERAMEAAIRATTLNTARHQGWRPWPTWVENGGFLRTPNFDLLLAGNRLARHTGRENWLPNKGQNTAVTAFYPNLPCVCSMVCRGGLSRISLLGGAGSCCEYSCF
jgi:hypothetical protein